jgi:hypothetical protein
MSGAIPLLPLYAFVTEKEKFAFFNFLFPSNGNIISYKLIIILLGTVRRGLGVG